MFILSSIFSDLEFWSVNHISVNEKFEWNIFEKVQMLGENYLVIDKRFIRNKCIEDSLILLKVVVDNITMDQYYFSNF